MFLRIIWTIRHNKHFLRLFIVRCRQATNNYVDQYWSTSGKTWQLSVMGHSMRVNPFKLRQNGRHFPDDAFKCICLNENIWVSIKFSLKLVPNGPMSNIPSLVQIMAWRRLGDKPLSEPMMVNLLTHICVTRPQWINARMQKTGVT